MTEKKGKLRAMTDKRDALSMTFECPQEKMGIIPLTPFSKGGQDEDLVFEQHETCPTTRKVVIAGSISSCLGQQWDYPLFLAKKLSDRERRWRSFSAS
jgi:hypothetical protein